MPLDRMDARRIALIKPSALGDIVHSLPVLTALRVRFPSARITWVVNSAYEPLITDHPDLTDTLAFDRGAFTKGVWHATRYAMDFAANCAAGSSISSSTCKGSSAPGSCVWRPVRAGAIGFANAREGSRYAYTHRIRVPDADRIHAVDRYWRVAEALGAGDVPKRFHVPLDPAEVNAAREELADLPRPWIAVAVGAKWVTKRWPTAHFAELLSRAQTHFGGTCVFVGTGDDTALSQEVIAQPSRVRRSTLTGKTSLPRLAALLSLSDVMLGNDTGPLHLAAALGRPCVAPYTCTRVALHGPYTSRAAASKLRCPAPGAT